MKPVLEPKEPNLKLRKTTKLIDKSDATEEQKYIDNWLEARRRSRNYGDQLGGPEKARQMTNLYSVEEKSPIDFYKDHYESSIWSEDQRYNMAADDSKAAIRSGTRAAYSPDKHSMFNFNVGEKDQQKSTILHEYTHSLNASKQERKISKVIKVEDDYLDSPTEIYSRLMQTRRLHKMDPKKNYSLDEIKKMKSSLFHTDDGLNLIERYSPKELHYLFNRVADNKIKPKSAITPKYT